MLTWQGGRALNKMVRNFRCDFKEAPCDDPRCKLGHCAPEHEINLEYKRAGPISSHKTPHATADQRALIAAAKKFAKEILRAKRIKPTPQLIAKVMELPKVLAEAQRRVDWAKNPK